MGVWCLIYHLHHTQDKGCRRNRVEYPIVLCYHERKIDFCILCLFFTLYCNAAYIKQKRKGEIYMCGIVGFTGNHQAAPILLDGLSKLEYRGYDSAGIATVMEKARQRLLRQRASESTRRKNKRRRICSGNLWYRTYPLGNTWRTVRKQCTSACER